VRAALTALQHTVTSVALNWTHKSMSELAVQLTDTSRLHSATFQGRESLVYLTAQLGIADRLEALLHRCPHLVGFSSSVYSFALHCTARSGNLGCALVLLRHGCDPNVRNSLSGRTIAHFACERGPAQAAVHCPSTLQFLVDRGANVNVAASRTESPAYRAAAEGAAASLRILLAAGADARGLAFAAWKRPACLDVLGGAGVDLDADDYVEGTVAHRAARDGQLESLRTLHKHGANMFALSRAEETPEELAARNGFTECVDFLAELRVSESAWSSPIETTLSPMQPTDVDGKLSRHPDATREPRRWIQPRDVYSSIETTRHPASQKSEPGTGRLTSQLLGAKSTFLLPKWIVDTGTPVSWLRCFDASHGSAVVT
jgi:ankyrin repeat protein